MKSSLPNCSFSGEPYETLGSRTSFLSHFSGAHFIASRASTKWSSPWHSLIQRMKSKYCLKMLHIPLLHTSKRLLPFENIIQVVVANKCLRYSHPVQLETIYLGKQIFHPSDATTIKLKMIPLVMTQLTC